MLLLVYLQMDRVSGAWTSVFCHHLPFWWCLRIFPSEQNYSKNLDFLATQNDKGNAKI